MKKAILPLLFALPVILFAQQNTMTPELLLEAWALIADRLIQKTSNTSSIALPRRILPKIKTLSNNTAYLLLAANRKK